MHALLLQLLTYAQGMWRFRWYALLLAWVISLGGWAWVYSLPDQYQASARVYVDTQSVLRPLLKGLAVESDVNARVDVMTRTLLSRPNLEKVARETDLDLRAETPKAMDALVLQLQQSVNISGSRRNDNVYTISYIDKNPRMAQKVVQAVLNRLVEGTLGSSRADAVVAQRFLDDQIHEYEVRLTEAEQRLADFKKKHLGVMPTEGQGYYGRLQVMLDNLDKTQAALREAENRRNELRKQLVAEQENKGPVAPTDVQKKIEQRQAELDALLLKYTDQHPDVVALKETIAQLKARSVQEGGKKDPEALALDPVYQALKIELSKADVEVATLRGKVADRQREIDQVRGMVNTIPEVEADLKRLNRDYNITKAQYDSLVQRRESARLSQQAEQNSDDVKFRIVDPPITLREPVGPKRFQYLSVVLVLSVLAGIGLAFALNDGRPVFLSSSVLREVTGLPVLGSVSMKWMPAQQRRLRVGVALFAFASVSLLVVYGGAILFERDGVRLAQSLLQMV